MTKKIDPTELDLTDFRDMEKRAIQSIQDGKRMILENTELLTLAIQNIHRLKGETEEERINRLAQSARASSINSTAGN